MTREIIALTGSIQNPNSQIERYKLLFRYPIQGGPITYLDADSGTQTFIPTPSIQLSAEASQATTSDEQAQFDSGTFGFSEEVYDYDPRITGSEAETEITSFYNERKTLFDRRVAVAYKRWMLTIDIN